MDPRLIVLALGSFAGNMESVVLPVLLPAIGAETGRTLSQAGYIVFAYSIAYAISAPVLASLWGSADRRRVLAFAQFILGGSALAIALAPDFIADRRRPRGACVRGRALHVDVAGDGDGDRAAGAAGPGGGDRCSPAARWRCSSVDRSVRLVAQQFGWRVDLRPRSRSLALTASAVICGGCPPGIIGETPHAPRAARGARQSRRAGGAPDGGAVHHRRFPVV